jgi:hypothetical protein
MCNAAICVQIPTISGDGEVTSATRRDHLPYVITVPLHGDIQAVLKFVGPEIRQS